MSTGYGTASPITLTSAERIGQVLCAGILLGAVLFNFGLAIVNYHVKALSSFEVIAAEATILAAAHAVALLKFRSGMAAWYAMLWFVTMIGIARWLWLADTDPKSIRDIVIVPTFVCLGIACGRRFLNPTVIVLQLIVLSVMVIEWSSPQVYSALAGVKSYYINTRGFGETSFWNTSSDLFVSATRPTTRYILPALGTQRLSSVFLEPVSLGNYCIIITAFLCATFKKLGLGSKLFLPASNIVLLIGSDGRLAAVTSVLIVGTYVLVRAPKYASVAYLPAATALAFILYYVFDIAPGPDNFSGRVALTPALLSKFTASDFLGVSGEAVSRYADSGIAYIISTQSVVGLFILWGFIVFASAEDTAEQVRYKHAMCLYVAVTMMVSYSFLTIKTSALAWFIHGALQTAGPYRRTGRHQP